MVGCSGVAAGQTMSETPCSLLSLMQQQPQNKDIIDLTKNDVQGVPSAKSYLKKRNGDFSSSPYDD